MKTQTLYRDLHWEQTKQKYSRSPRIHLLKIKKLKDMLAKHQDTITQEVSKVLDENKHPAARRARGNE